MSSIAAAPPVGKLETGRFTVIIPDNGITPIGVDLIQDKLAGWLSARIPDGWLGKDGKHHSWEWTWKVGGRGEYVGALPKRVGKYAYQELGVKLTAKQLSEIGNLAAQHSVRNETYFCAIVDDFDWSDGDFGDGGSCYWGGNAGALDMLKDNGGRAILFWRDEAHTTGFARAWVVPFEDCYVVFNGYGLETLPIARVLSAHLGHAYYRRINFANNGASAGTLWINGGTAWLVGPQSSVVEIDSIDLDWEEPEVSLSCERCGDSINEDYHSHAPDGNDYCEHCYCEHVSYCEHCSEDVWAEEAQSDPNGDTICDDCYRAKCSSCEGCDDSFWNRDMKDGYCPDCHLEKYSDCEECGKECHVEDLERVDDCDVCSECAEEMRAGKEEVVV